VLGLNFHRIQLNDVASSAFILLIFTFIIHATDLFGRLDNLIFDIGQRVAKTPPPDDVIIIAIDQVSLSQIGRWPWSRDVHARLLRQLSLENPSVIGFDVIFAEPDQTNPLADLALANAIAESKKVVLPVLLETVRANGQIIETLPMQNLMAYAADVGRVHAVLDEDSIARSVYLFEGVETPAWQLFSQAVLNVAENKETKNNFSNLPNNIRLNPYNLARKDQRRVNFLGPPGHFNQLSYVQVLNGEFSHGLFKDKILLIGATALGMNDLLTTPVSGQRQPMAGVEFHANVLESLRNDKLIQQVPFWLSTVVVLALSIMPLLWMPKSSALIGFLTTILFMILVAVIAGAVPKLWDVWIPPAAALVALILAYPIWSWRKLEAAQRFLDFELNYLRQNLTSLPVDKEHSTLEGYDQFDARIAQVRTASQQLRYLNEDRKETLAFISHDIRAPLAGAIAMLEQYEDIKQQLHKPLSQALSLAEDFLQASRAEMMDSASFVEVDLPSIVHQAADDAYEMAIEKQMILVRDITEDVVWVKGNFNLLHRAILNLMMNSIKYGKKNTQVKVSVSINQEKSHVIFSVMDHGPGISIADQANLFKRFSRVKGHENLADGAGLGLYFVRTVAEKHSGSIDVESDLNKPTTFSLYLPIVDFVRYSDS
jgi:CHASE2 domain-containing sensor protein/nitrogen-specific signal transduction histidine kinase